MSTANVDAILQNIGSEEYFPISYEELEQGAKQKMSAGAFGYVRSGAGGEETLRKNEDSFKKLSIVPRVLSDVAGLDTSINLFGRIYPHPLLLAPVGMLKMADEQADLAVAKAAAEHQIPVVLSTVASYSMEEVAAAAKGPKWFQLYWSNNEEVSFSMVKRAEEAGYEAIVLTVDTVMMGWRQEDMRNRFSPLKLGYGKANYETDPVFLNSLGSQDSDSIIQGILDNIHHPGLNWKHVAELKKRTSLPLLLKGILHPEDAKLAVANGIDGLIVSNHGGRQLDGVISAIDALPHVVESVNGSVPVLIDSGIRRGSDVVKALALGAAAVLIGRPFVYGLAVGGQNGVEKVLENFIQETKVSISLSGVSSIKDLPSLKIVRA
ncbi:alpha-hydroxy-acid oxidizing protein [Peribacillus saganii]|uniref:L-lactate oxidase n=1 Tax=Peribacillus saganii TaxID=2303992 RepID=A0A372LLT0_9BACI|nr:alpha-hydroxy-acid oxidizing protein [Peribacillus saganii]RFU67324.1 alpha-hydroxy-acid oxidizing protein [Peribacillus saganii]